MSSNVSSQAHSASTSSNLLYDQYQTNRDEVVRKAAKGLSDLYCVQTIYTDEIDSNMQISAEDKKRLKQDLNSRINSLKESIVSGWFKSGEIHNSGSISYGVSKDIIADIKEASQLPLETHQKVIAFLRADPTYKFAHCSYRKMVTEDMEKEVVKLLSEAAKNWEAEHPNPAPRTNEMLDDIKIDFEKTPWDFPDSPR